MIDAGGVTSIGSPLEVGEAGFVEDGSIGIFLGPPLDRGSLGSGLRPIAPRSFQPIYPSLRLDRSIARVVSHIWEYLLSTLRAVL